MRGLLAAAVLSANVNWSAATGERVQEGGDRFEIDSDDTEETCTVKVSLLQMALRMKSPPFSRPPATSNVRHASMVSLASSTSWQRELHEKISRFGAACTHLFETLRASAHQAWSSGGAFWVRGRAVVKSSIVGIPAEPGRSHFADVALLVVAVSGHGAAPAVLLVLLVVSVIGALAFAHYIPVATDDNRDVNSRRPGPSARRRATRGGSHLSSVRATALEELGAPGIYRPTSVPPSVRGSLAPRMPTSQTSATYVTGDNPWERHPMDEAAWPIEQGGHAAICPPMIMPRSNEQQFYIPFEAICSISGRGEPISITGESGRTLLYARAAAVSPHFSSSTSNIAAGGGAFWLELCTTPTAQHPHASVGVLDLHVRLAHKLQLIGPGPDRRQYGTLERAGHDAELGWQVKLRSGCVLFRLTAAGKEVYTKLTVLDTAGNTKAIGSFPNKQTLSVQVEAGADAILILLCVVVVVLARRAPELPVMGTEVEWSGGLHQPSRTHSMNVGRTVATDHG